jgi:acyl-CoA thioesterase FadM
LAFEDVVDVDLWISRLGRKTIEFSFEMLCRGETAARGQLLTIACRVAKDGRVESIPLPEAFRAALAVSTRPAVVFRGPPEGGSR